MDLSVLSLQMFCNSKDISSKRLLYIYIWIFWLLIVHNGIKVYVLKIRATSKLPHDSDSWPKQQWRPLEPEYFDLVEAQVLAQTVDLFL